MLDHCDAGAKRAGLDGTQFDFKTFRSNYATRTLRTGFDVRTVQHWMDHKSPETTMRCLVPSKEVHARLDQVTVPGLDEIGDLDKRGSSQRARTRSSIRNELRVVQMWVGNLGGRISRFQSVLLVKSSARFRNPFPAAERLVDLLADTQAHDFRAVARRRLES
jgi:hypothetical protein